jgi:hypothetical protein
MLTALNTLPLQKETTDQRPGKKPKRLTLGQRIAQGDKTPEK